MVWQWSSSWIKYGEYVVCGPQLGAELLAAVVVAISRAAAMAKASMQWGPANGNQDVGRPLGIKSRMLSNCNAFFSSGA
jgi:hypothetical protein